jgi:uncharacterized protein (TIGR02757 family)
MKKRDLKNLKEYLDEQVEKYNKPNFIELDPISIPHEYSLKQDIEIAAFWTSIISWGNRKSIIKSAQNLFTLMDHAPYDFILNHKEKDLKKLENFKHRTFQFTDTLGFIHFLKGHYESHSSLEDAFLLDGKINSIKDSLIHFNSIFFNNEEFVAKRTMKHIANPAKKSTCKRLNMFLRWMVRKDDKGVDFGLWDKISMHHLMMPLDVHVEKVGRNLGLIHRQQSDWETVEELTENLRYFDTDDPVKYDFALFGLGVNSEKS